MSVTNRFYVGAEHIGRDISNGVITHNTFATVEEAIRKAKADLLRDPSRGATIVVQIIRVLRQAEPPIMVEVV